MQKTCPWSNGTIHYRIYGEGIPVVLLHGFGEDSSIWDRQVEALKKTYKLIVPDLPGTGESIWLSISNGEWSMLNVGTSTIDYSPFTIDSLADAVHAMIQHEAIDDCYLLGHSMGGYIALAFAEKYPSLLKGLGLIHSTAFADSEEKKKNRLRGIELMEQYGGYSFLKTTIPNLFGERFKKIFPDEVEALIEKAATLSTPSLQAYYHAMMSRPNRTVVLKGNPLPVLFVLGMEDVAAPLNDVLQQTHLPLLSYIHILEGVGHMGMWESTERLNGYLSEFIQ